MCSTYKWNGAQWLQTSTYKWTAHISEIRGKKSFGEFLNSPEKISTSVLTSRLRQLECAGIAQYVLSKKDKKVKHYYLTDKGIDLFPIFYEMVYWSKRNLNKPFNDISMDWFSRYDKFTPSFTAKENKENYKGIRAEILEF